jgi:hypothetical protein
MRVAIVLVAASSILVGCASTVRVRIEEPLNNDGVFSYDQVNARMQWYPGKVFCVDGAEYDVNGVVVTKDSTVFAEIDSGLRHSIPTHALVKIQRKDYGAGAFTGGLVGSLAGLAVGVGILIFQTDASADSRMGLGFATLGMMGGGALFGVALGAVEGSTQEFQFQPPASRRQSSPDSTRSAAR